MPTGVIPVLCVNSISTNRQQNHVGKQVFRGSIAAPGILQISPHVRDPHPRAKWMRETPTASAMELRLSTYHALHVCKSSLAGDPIIDTIRFTSTSEGRHSRLDRQPDVSKLFLARRDRTRRRLMVE